MKPRIRLVVTRPNGHCSDIKITGDAVTPAMLEAAEDLITTLASGERTLPKDFYDACAAAFCVTRDDAKKRLIAAMYVKGKV